MEPVVIGAIIFVISVVIIELLVYAYHHMRSSERSRIRKRLRKYSYVQATPGSTDILKKRVLSDVPFLDQLLWHIPGIGVLDRLITQANAAYPIGFYLLLALLLALITFAGVKIMNGTYLLAIPAALVAGALPFLNLKRMKSQRMEKFKRQLPEGLSLIARSIKAGHALTTGMKLAADEFGDPLGPELSEVLDEINFGVSVAEALKNLARRIDCPEIKYFVVAVILQRESGGNLAELMESLAGLIRDKFTFQGKVRTLAAEGKLSAIILVMLPFFVFFAIRLANPVYMDPLFTKLIGKIMIGSALGLMLLGIVFIKNLIKIEV